MAYNNNKKRSWFAEQRERNSDPNFMNRMDIFTIRQNVRRIIRDAAEQNILPEDMVYFKNTNLLNACLQESYEQMKSANVTYRALDYYKNWALPNLQMPPFVDVYQDGIDAGIEMGKISAKCQIWDTAYRAFYMIQNNGANPADVLMSLSSYPRDMLKNI